ncbi:MAG TPA: DUF4190 domain-containing protein [Rhodanobacteraceae bacterium]|nr:DUF4190 domain-containing protein [Rhodanobacteraceae bacterium]
MNTVYPRTSSLAVVSLVFGILAWLPPLLPVIGALIAVVCGHSARSEIRRAPPGSIDGDGMALAGLILGWLQLGLGVLVVGLVILFLAGLVAFHQFH